MSFGAPTALQQMQPASAPMGPPAGITPHWQGGRREGPSPQNMIQNALRNGFQTQPGQQQSPVFNTMNFGRPTVGPASAPNPWSGA